MHVLWRQIDWNNSWLSVIFWKLSPGIGLLVLHQMYEEENSHIRPFIVIGSNTNCTLLCCKYIHTILCKFFQTSCQKCWFANKFLFKSFSTRSRIDRGRHHDRFVFCGGKIVVLSKFSKTNHKKFQGSTCLKIDVIQINVSWEHYFS